MRQGQGGAGGLGWEHNLDLPSNSLYAEDRRYMGLSESRMTCLQAFRHNCFSTRILLYSQNVYIVNL